MTPAGSQVTRAHEGGADAAAPVIRLGIVDDHRLVLDGLVAHLRFQHPDIRVEAAETGWAQLLRHPGFPFDVVVLDVSLGDGVPVETKIRSLATAGVRTVVMSRHADGITVHSALRAGALAFVSKSEDAAELVAAVRSASRGERRRAAEAADANPTAMPGLGERELRAIMLYAAGRTVLEVAEAMDTTEETVKSYLKRARRKYRAAGIEVGTRVLLRRHAVREGWITPE